MNDEGGIATATENSETSTVEDFNLGIVPYFSFPDIHSSQAPDIPEAMDEESIKAEERNLFYHPALGTEW